MPQTKYANVIATNDPLPNATFTATAAEVSAISSTPRGGNGTLSPRPAYQAAGAAPTARENPPPPKNKNPPLPSPPAVSFIQELSDRRRQQRAERSRRGD